jgi:hypothetical protein
MRFPTVAPRRALWLLGWAAALVAGGASSALLIRPEQNEAQPLPAWMSITTAGLMADAKECYRREAIWQASTYCASPVDDVVEVVWASCFGEEQRLLLAAIEDSASDAVGMKFLADLEHQSRGDVVPMIREGQSTSPHCFNSD